MGDTPHVKARNARSAYEALRLLSEGNARFAEGRVESPNSNYERRKLTSEEGQVLFAAVLACSDSRAPFRLFSIEA